MRLSRNLQITQLSAIADDWISNACYYFQLKINNKQLLDLVYGFLHLKCIIKQLLDSVFVICQIINVSVRAISLAFGSADNFYIDIDTSVLDMIDTRHPIIVCLM